MKIHNPTIPFDKNKNLVKAYNDRMELAEFDDFVVFLDHDAMFTTYDWGVKLEKYIKDHPDYSCFVGVTNRIGSLPQLVSNAPKDDDIVKHRFFGSILAKDDTLQDFTQPTPNHFSGVMFALKKSAWKQVGGFKAWSSESNILGIDSAMHRDLFKNGLKTGIMKGLYVYHWYRGGKGNTNHLK